MAHEDIREKWDQRYRQNLKDEWPAAEVLSENLHLLPRSGTALDLACGYGANALLLAQHGLNVFAWDISSVAIEAIKIQAQQLKLNMTAEIFDLDKTTLPENRFDVVVVAHYLDRNIIQDISASLKKNGLLFYQTFIDRKVNPEVGPKSEGFLLRPNELLTLFSNLQLLVYREEATQGDTSQGFRDKAMFIGKKI